VAIKARQSTCPVPTGTSAHLGTDRVLDVHLADPAAQHSQRFDRIALIVEDHIGRIEVDTHVLLIQLLQHLEQHWRNFLPGLESQIHAGIGKNISYLRKPTQHFAEIQV
jgi:hypothetical protein